MSRLKEQVEKIKKIIYNIDTRLRDEYPESTEHGETPLESAYKGHEAEVASLNSLWECSSVG